MQVSQQPVGVPDVPRKGVAVQHTLEHCQAVVVWGPVVCQPLVHGSRKNCHGRRKPVPETRTSYAATQNTHNT